LHRSPGTRTKLSGYPHALEVVDEIAHNANDWHELFKLAGQAPGAFSTTRDFFWALSVCHQYRHSMNLGDDVVLKRNPEEMYTTLCGAAGRE
jgi:hypothetical protein